MLRFGIDSFLKQTISNCRVIEIDGPTNGSFRKKS